MLDAAFRCGRLPSGKEIGAWGAIEVVGSWEASAAAGRCDCDERARFEAATPSSGLIKLREIAWPAGRAPVSEGALISDLSELEVVFFLVLRFLFIY